MQQRNAAGIFGLRKYLPFLGGEFFAQIEQGLFQLLRSVGSVKGCVYLIQHLTQSLTTIRIRSEVGMVNIPQS